MGIKVVLIEDDVSLNRLVYDYLSLTKLFDIVAVAYDGQEGLELLKRHDPDICILDIFLPKKDGFYILEELRKNKITKTSFIITSAVYNDFIIGEIIELGACYYILKPFDLSLLERRMLNVYNFKNENKDKIENFERLNLKDDPHDDENIRIDRFIEGCLGKVGIEKNLKGYTYLKVSIRTCILDESMLESITKILYHEVAKIYCTTPSGVERAIRHCISKSSERDNGGLYKELFQSYTDEKVTNRKFISMVTKEYQKESQ